MFEEFSCERALKEARAALARDAGDFSVTQTSKAIRRDRRDGRRRGGTLQHALQHLAGPTRSAFAGLKRSAVTQNSRRAIMGAIASTMSAQHSCGVFPHDTSAQPAHYFKSRSTGILLHYRSWLPPATSPATNPKATIYLCHGYGEHLGRHEPFALALTAAGFTVHALDLQGHGQSHGDRAYLTSLDDVVADVLELATRVAPSQAGVPSFIFGHSMGGLITLRTVQSSAGAAMFSGAVLSGPAIMIDPKIDTSFNRWLALTFSNVLPKLPVTPLEPNKLCSDKRVIDQYMMDPLV